MAEIGEGFFQALDALGLGSVALVELELQELGLFLQLLGTELDGGESAPREHQQHEQDYRDQRQLHEPLTLHGRAVPETTVPRAAVVIFDRNAGRCNADNFVRYPTR
ncbi:MAG TPA: hypothetical protein VJV78_49675 [Polyangiales bacterium]|nr:hypothetical protein [Polyangiales bacterium]